MKKKLKRFLCGMMATGLTVAPLTTVYATNEDSSFPTTYTSQDGQYLFEKVSHRNSGTEEKDGIVDYTSPLQITENTTGTSENADSVQSYTYCAATSGDWVYMGTMYGALSAYTQVERAVTSFGASADVAKAVVDVMFNGKLNKGKEDDGIPAGSVFLKFNIKTGETKILMSRTLYNQGKCDGVPIFRAATEYNGKLYFVGLVSDGKALAGQKMYGMDIPNDPNVAINYEIAYQNGVPCVYELDPSTDKLVKVAQCVTTEGYRALNNQFVFTSTRAIDTFTATKADGTKEDWLLAGGLADTTQGETFGATIMAAKNPETVTSDFMDTDLGKLHGSFKTIADQNDMYNYPAVNRTDSEGGGGLYQIVQYGENTIYASIVTGKASDGTKEQAYAVVKGVYDPTAGDVNDKNAWTWTPVIGNLNDNAKYTFGIDPSRTACGAATLQVYDDYLYIGEYNDVNYSLTDILTNKSFKILAKNLAQSINLYRMDHNENIQMVVGDPTDMFSQSLTGIGSGYASHMNQYTWMTNVVGDTMYLSTMDETSLTHSIAQFVNGELLNMSQEEWESQLNYILVLVKLMFNSSSSQAAVTMDNNHPDVEAIANEETISREDAEAFVEDVLAELNAEGPMAASLDDETSTSTFTPVTLTEEQKEELIDAVVNGTIKNSLSEDDFAKLEQLNTQLRELREMLNDHVSDDFIEMYDQLLKELKELLDSMDLPENIQAMYNMLLSFVTSENLGYLSTCLNYMKDSEAGFDFYAIKQAEDGSVNVSTLTTNGFGDRYNHGLRIITEVPGYLVIGTANPFFGAQVWRAKVDNASTPETTPTPEVTPSPEPTTTPEVKPEPTATPESKPANKSTDTSDNSHIALYGVALIAAIAIGFFTFKKTKKN